MDGNVPCFNFFSEDLDLIQIQQLIFSNKPANSSNTRFADAVSITEFEKRISDLIPKKKLIIVFLYQEKMHFFPISDIDILKM